MVQTLQRVGGALRFVRPKTDDSERTIPLPLVCITALDEVRLHGMRHTCVSLLLHLGIAPNVVREIVGHSDIEVTMTIYAHTSLDDKRLALRKLGDALR